MHRHKQNTRSKRYEYYKGMSSGGIVPLYIIIPYTITSSYTMGPGPGLVAHVTCLVAVLHAASVIGCWGRAAGAASVIVCW